MATVNSELEDLFGRLGGKLEDGWPYFDSPVFQTAGGTLYLKDSGVSLLARPEVRVEGLRPFLSGFPKELQFEQYLDDPVTLPSGTRLAKAAGQLCYMSFGPARSTNAQGQRYIDHIKESKHGSVLEHAQYSFLFWGISRSVTHEWVRHRTGKAYSQVSQRYVSGKVLRFVERVEYQEDPEDHKSAELWFDLCASEYNRRTERLLKRQADGDRRLTAEAKTDKRKRVQQVARSCLPNEAEAPIVISGNARALRHVMEMRANAGADTEIRMPAFKQFLMMAIVDPYLFGDYKVIHLDDGSYAIDTPYRKV